MNIILMYMLWSSLMCLPVFIAFGTLFYMIKADAKMDKLMDEVRMEYEQIKMQEEDDAR